MVTVIDCLFGGSLSLIHISMVIDGYQRLCLVIECCICFLMALLIVNCYLLLYVVILLLLVIISDADMEKISEKLPQRSGTLQHTVNFSH